MRRSDGENLAQCEGSKTCPAAFPAAGHRSQIGYIFSLRAEARVKGLSLLI
jgi:hypothetical protein